MIVVVIGASGAGKTTVGKKLAGALGWTFYEGDDFHPPENVARMKAGMPLGDAERAPWLAALAALIAQLVRGRVSAVITCSALKRAYRAALVDRETAPHARFVFLHAPPAVLTERLAKRRGHFFPPSLLESQLADLELPADNEPSPVVTIDAAQSPDEIVGQIINELTDLRR